MNLVLETREPIKDHVIKQMIFPQVTLLPTPDQHSFQSMQIAQACDHEDFEK